ncbi:MAG: YopX family protein [Owenweeksia sp.]|nr:YopX family protein [Owenweeksia sp.]
MNTTEPRYRLRNDEKIIGYMRKMANTMVMYSRDSYWWTGRKMSYKNIDEWTGLKDMNGRHIYEWDILHYKLDPDGQYHTGVILWEETNGEFGIRNVEDRTFIPLTVQGVQMFNHRQLKVFSYLFLNPDLQEKLGVSE